MHLFIITQQASITLYVPGMVSAIGVQSLLPESASHACYKTPNRNSLIEKRVIWAHGFRDCSPWSAGHLVAVRKQKQNKRKEKNTKGRGQEEKIVLEVMFPWFILFVRPHFLNFYHLSIMQKKKNYDVSALIH